MNEKIDAILEKLKADSSQEDVDPREELKKNIRTNLTILGRAELWASGMRGTPEEADELMQAGFEKMKSELYTEPGQIDVINEVLDEVVAERGSESLFGKLITNNRASLRE